MVSTISRGCGGIGRLQMERGKKGTSSKLAQDTRNLHEGVPQGGEEAVKRMIGSRTCHHHQIHTSCSLPVFHSSPSHPHPTSTFTPSPGRSSSQKHCLLLQQQSQNGSPIPELSGEGFKNQLISLKIALNE